MTRNALVSPDGAVDALARLYQDHRICVLSVREDRAFSDSEFLSLGTVELFPEGQDLGDYARALRYGHFEWSTPSLTDAATAIARLLDVDTSSAPGDAKLPITDKLHRILDSIGALSVRLGLTHPVFDPHALAAMPFRRPTTVVSDTSGVLQGGLSFVSRYLYPAARVKVPAIVQMEIVNQADRFLSIRRGRKPRRQELLRAHLNSQAGQRVLLQLELHSDVELERTFLFGDPLRGAFKQEEDQELRELNLSVPLRSYVDRLILEAARRHQSQVAIGHSVTILTSDQGLARMALAEGMRPLYFHAATAKALFSRRFTGTNFHPFSGALSFTGVSDVLWELATIFGSARLGVSDANEYVTVHAIGDDLAWAPYHSHDDLLWLESNSRDPAPSRSRMGNSPLESSGPGSSQASAGQATRHGLSHGERDEDDQRSGPHEGSEPMARQRPDPRVDAAEALGLGFRDGDRAKVGPEGERLGGRYKYSVAALLSLVDRLDADQELPVSDVMEVLGVRTASGLKDYRRFLESGGAIAVDSKTWSAARPLSALAVALRNLDIVSIRKVLHGFPSYATLMRGIKGQPIGAPMDWAAFGRAGATLGAWAELTELGAPVHGSGFFVTPAMPDDDDFAAIAVAAYEKIRGDGQWVATGRWLEQLIVEHGIHPNNARVRVHTASGAGVIRAITEGSTTEMQYESHTVRVLDVADGVPIVRIEYLYRGDFLIPGKSSSSVRIERVEP